jgi:hypothetical protein
VPLFLREATVINGMLRNQAPTVRNVRAWANGPGTSSPPITQAPTGRNKARRREFLWFYFALSGLGQNGDGVPGATLRFAPGYDIAPRWGWDRKCLTEWHWPQGVFPTEVVGHRWDQGGRE